MTTKPFPWKCAHCRQKTVHPSTEPYKTQVEHDGRCYEVRLPSLTVYRCQNCGAGVLDDEANAKISEAFRGAAGLLTPKQIRENRVALGLTQRELAAHLDVSESTLSRWETGGQIQQRAMDKLLRLFFEVPAARTRLGFSEGAAPQTVA